MQTTDYFWLGLAGRTSLRQGIREGFCAFCRGEIAQLAELCPGDRILYYSPAERIGDRMLAESFTAFGQVLETPSRRDLPNLGCGPCNRSIDLVTCPDVPLQPLLPLLSFSRTQDWRHRTRRHELLRILPDDYRIITEAMRIPDGR